MSRSLDKSLGREADPEGGKIYDKGSAWAGAATREERKLMRQEILKTQIHLSFDLADSDINFLRLYVHSDHRIFVMYAHFDYLRVTPFLRRFTHLLVNRRMRSGGPLSRPLDRSLGRKADPEGGKIYDKGSAWAGAVASKSRK